MKWPDLRRLDGYLPPDLEKSYRLRYLREDTRTATITMFLLSFLLVAFGFNDYLLFGLSPTFFWLVSLRTVFLVYFIILLIYIRRIQSPTLFDNTLFIWLMLSLVMVCLIDITRPPSFTGNFIINVILILLVYLCMPIRLGFRVTGAITFSIVEFIIFAILRERGPLVMEVTITLSIIAANIGGIFASNLIYSHRRSEFQARMEREQLVDQWQTTFNAISDMISIQDRDFKILRANKAFSDALGMRPEDYLGRHCYEVVHETQCAIDNCPHQKTLESGRPASEEIFEPRLNVYLEVSTYPMTNSAGQITGTVHVAKDITERMRMQKELEKIS